jgi:hypothetical protein
MRRTLAFCAAAIALRALPAAAQPMELELNRLGSPSQSVWQNILSQCQAAGHCPGVTSVAAGQLSFESQQRYRALVMQLALGLTAPVLEDATTGGLAGWDASAEMGGAEIRHSDARATAAPFGPALRAWPVRGDNPNSLRTFGLHVQKGGPASTVIGARLLYVDQSMMFAGQIEGRWAINENDFSSYVPDVAVRGAYTRLFGARNLDLHVVDVDLIVSKRFGLWGLLRTAPYAVVRYSMVKAHTALIDFGPTSGTCATTTCYPDTRTPAQVLATSAAFPDMNFGDNATVRYALGAKVNSGKLALAAEMTYYPGKKLPDTGQIAAVLLPDAIGYSLRLGGDF